MSKYFSQFHQDEFIDKVILRKKRNGFFVDIGAHDGVSLSNSYFFEKQRGFTGLCVEPNPKVFATLQQNRKCTLLNACISSSVEPVKFLVLDGMAEMLSGIVDAYNPLHLERIDRVISEEGGSKKEILVQSTPLQNIPEIKGKKIDYISIDTEGNEKDVLKSIDFKEIKVCCFTIENNYSDDEISEMMLSNNYIKLIRLGEDDVFILKEYYNFGIRFRKALFLYKRKIKYYFDGIVKKLQIFNSTKNDI
jgi:FkbM family methyltransferase